MRLPRATGLRPTFSLERAAGADKNRIVAGVDEVGRGAVAGPVVAAAAVLNPRQLPSRVKRQVRDSKLLTRQARSALFSALASTTEFATGMASVAEIDRLNVLQASLLAMRRAVEGLPAAPDFVLIDGDHLPVLPCPGEAVVAGDRRCLSIAVASILAKVTRDRLMADLALAHPGYGWEHNAGYATPDHVRALIALGPSPQHRRSFRIHGLATASE